MERFELSGAKVRKKFYVETRCIASLQNAEILRGSFFVKKSKKTMKA